MTDGVDVRVVVRGRRPGGGRAAPAPRRARSRSSRGRRRAASRAGRAAPRASRRSALSRSRIESPSPALVDPLVDELVDALDGARGSGRATGPRSFCTSDIAIRFGVEPRHVERAAQRVAQLGVAAAEDHALDHLERQRLHPRQRLAAACPATHVSSSACAISAIVVRPALAAPRRGTAAAQPALPQVLVAVQDQDRVRPDERLQERAASPPCSTSGGAA